MGVCVRAFCTCMDGPLAPSSIALTRTCLGLRAERLSLPRVGSAGLSWSCRLLKAARALFVSLSPGAGSAAFTGPIKHRSWPLPHTAHPGTPSLPGPGKTSFFSEQLISQTHKLTRNTVGVCAPKDNYRAPLSWRLVQREQLCPHSGQRLCLSVLRQALF